MIDGRPNATALWRRVNRWIEKDERRSEKYGLLVRRTVSNYLAGKRRAPLVFFLALEGAFPQWRADWLHLGQGAPTRVDEEALTKLHVRVAHYAESEEEKREHVEAWREVTLALAYVVELPWDIKQAIALFLIELWRRGELPRTLDKDELQGKVRAWFSSALSASDKDSATAAAYATLAALYLALPKATGA